MDSRILKATEKVLAEEICEIVLVGKEEEIKSGESHQNIDNYFAISLNYWKWRDCWGILWHVW